MEFITKVLELFDCYYDNYYVKSFLDSIMLKQTKIVTCNDGKELIRENPDDNIYDNVLLRPYIKTLELPIPYIKDSTIQDYILKYMEKEDIDEENNHNSSCSDGKMISQQFNIEKLKDGGYLLLSLKRFDNKFVKINKKVTVSDRLSIEDTTNIFREYCILGCIIHYGDSIRGGHYVYAVYSYSNITKQGKIKYIIDDGKIYSYEDYEKTVRKVEVEKNGYVFLYESLGKN